MSKIGFIGAGSMAESMIKGLLKSGIMSNEDIIVTNKTNEKRLEELKVRYGSKRISLVLLFMKKRIFSYLL